MVEPLARVFDGVAVPSSLAREDAGENQAACGLPNGVKKKVAQVSGSLAPHCPCQGFW